MARRHLDKHLHGGQSQSLQHPAEGLSAWSGRNAAGSGRPAGPPGVSASAPGEYSRGSVSRGSSAGLSACSGPAAGGSGLPAAPVSASASGEVSRGSTSRGSSALEFHTLWLRANGSGAGASDNLSRGALALLRSSSGRLSRASPADGASRLRPHDGHGDRGCENAAAAPGGCDAAFIEEENSAAKFVGKLSLTGVRSALLFSSAKRYPCELANTAHSHGTTQSENPRIPPTPW